MLLNVFIDESGTDGRSPFMIMAGYVGMLGHWERFDTRWRTHLKRNGLTYFHATEMNNRTGPYKGWSLTRVNTFAEKCVAITDRHALFGFTFRLDQADYQTHYIAGHRPRKPALDSMYGLCFRYCLSFLPDMARRFTEEAAPRLNFIIEDGHPNSGAVYVIADEVRRLKMPGVSDCLGTVKLADKKDHPGLQTADGLAYGAWHHEPHYSASLIDIPADASADLIRARGAMRAPIFRGHGEPASLALWKDELVAMAEVRRRYGEIIHRSRSGP